MIDKVRKQNKLTPKAIVAVDLFGLHADYMRLKDIASENNLLLFEDGEQGFGGNINSLH